MIAKRWGMHGVILAACAICPALSLLSTDETPPRFSIHTHPGLLAGLTWQDFRRANFAPTDMLDLLESPDFPPRVEAFLKLCGERGISEVIVDGVQPELGGIYFRSNDLEDRGWRRLPDIFSLLAERTNQHGLRLGINLSELGVHARGFFEDHPLLRRITPLDITDLEPFVKELRDRYGVESLTAEEFPVSWSCPLSQIAQQLGLRYVHRGNGDDIVTFAGADPRSTPAQVYPCLSFLSTRDYRYLASPEEPNGVVNGSLPLLMSGPDAIVETTPWYSGARFMGNLLRFRALQTAPQEMTLWMGPQELKQLPADLLPEVSQMRRLHDPSLPLLNLVVLGRPRKRLDGGHQAWLHLVSNLEPILMAGQAAAMRPVLSRRPLAGVAGYFVYLADPSPADWSELERFLESETSQPILIQFGAQARPEVQRQVLRFLEIEKGEWRSGIVPDFGLYRGQKVRVRGTDFYGGKVPTGSIHFAPDIEDVLMVDATRQPLLYRSRNRPERFLINGSLLHRGMAFPISQLLTDGKALQGPTDCFIAVGHKTAFWALEDTEVNWIDPRSGEGVSLEMKQGGFFLGSTQRPIAGQERRASRGPGRFGAAERFSVPRPASSPPTGPATRWCGQSRTGPGTYRKGTREPGRSAPNRNPHWDTVSFRRSSRLPERCVPACGPHPTGGSTR